MLDLAIWRYLQWPGQDFVNMGEHRLALYAHNFYYRTSLGLRLRMKRSQHIHQGREEADHLWTMSDEDKASLQVVSPEGFAFLLREADMAIEKVVACLSLYDLSRSVPRYSPGKGCQRIAS